MKSLLNFRNRIEHFYKQHNRIVGYCLRLVLSVIVFLTLRANLHYNTFLSNIWVIIGISILCGFLKGKFMLLVMLAYIVVQISTLSIGIGMLVLGILVLMYLLYLRYVDDYAFVLILLPLFFTFRIPLVIPLVLGTIAPMSALLAVAFGNIIYYLIHYININSAVISGLPADMSELDKVSMIMKGVFSYKEFLYTLGIMILVFVIVYFVKKINVNQSVLIAVLVGAGVYIILMILANLIFGTMATNRLLYILLGGVAPAIIALLFTNIIMPMDYSRTELMEFEDEEYYYFVRAVPKANIAKETVNVKRINARKVIGPEEKGKGNI